MQVSVAFARDFAREHDIPEPDIRARLYSRAGGLFYGIAHLLKYEFHYADWRHLFADYNAGHHASRNAGFQRMVSALSGQRLAPDGDLLSYADGGAAPSATYRAVLAALARHGVAADPPAERQDPAPPDHRMVRRPRRHALPAVPARAGLTPPAW